MDHGENLTTGTEESNEEVCINVVESLISSMSKELAALPNARSVCIFRVSEKYRKSKEEAYTPRIVSVGPLHHGKNHLQDMEATKLIYLQSFMNKFKVTIDKLIKYASNKEGSVRSSYEDTSKFKSEEFSRMILLDGIFVLQVFVKSLPEMRERGDLLSENKWMASDIMHDMLLLENQLPLNFIVGLFGYVDISQFRQQSFEKLVFDYFKGVGKTEGVNLKAECFLSRHLIEFLYYIHKPSKLEEVPDKMEKGRLEYAITASELHAAGVSFGIQTGDLFDVSFNSGKLQLPQLTVDDQTETFFRNLIAFEQCGHYEKYITSYVIFMDRLIDTAEDVDLLVKHKVLKNSLGESQLVANLFNNLHKEVIEEKKFYFAKICDELNNYSKDYIHEWNSAWFKWKLILKTEYFSNPWSFVAFIAASAVVLLTIVQTVCSILGL